MPPDCKRKRKKNKIKTDVNCLTQLFFFNTLTHLLLVIGLVGTGIVGRLIGIGVVVHCSCILVMVVGPRGVLVRVVRASHGWVVHGLGVSRGIGLLLSCVVLVVVRSRIRGSWGRVGVPAN